MSSAKVIRKKTQSPVEDKIVNFQNPKDILFPKICVICGATAEYQYKKIIFGTFESNKDYKEDYSLNIPVCFDCSTNLKMDTGYSSKSGKLLLTSSLIGLILAISLYFVIYSILLSISLITISIVLPYLNYNAKMKKKIRLNDFLNIKLGEDKKSLTFDFFNANYANYINEINSKKESEENPQENE